jgi:hypothetical protein
MNRFSKACVVIVILLLAVIALRPTVSPQPALGRLCAGKFLDFRVVRLKATQKFRFIRFHLAFNFIMGSGPKNSKVELLNLAGPALVADSLCPV